jgi:hypothetical protein
MGHDGYRRRVCGICFSLFVGFAEQRQKPNINERLKTNNPFPLNKTAPKNRTFMFGFSRNQR